jgi:hypothetical protein
MKKTFLFYSAVFFSLVASAQTTAQTQQTTAGAAKVEKSASAISTNAAAQSSSSTTVQTAAAAEAAAKAKSGVETGKEVIITKKDELKSAGQAGTEKADQLTNKEIKLGASAASANDVDAGPAKVQVATAADVNTGSAVSLKKVKENTIAVKDEATTRIENKTNATARQTADVATATQAKTTGAVKTTTAVAASSGTKVATAVKAKPTPLKVKARTVTAAGINLK